jgi:hypothetical protein
VKLTTLPVRIMTAALALTALLVGLVLRENQARASGREVRLPMEAVDPRDLLTGHYVALRLTQVVDPGQPCPPGLVGADWLALTPSDRGARLTGGATTRKGAQALGPIAMKGEARCLEFGSGLDAARSTDLDIRVRRFHIAQAQAQAMEVALRNRGAQPSYAVVSIGGDGKARLKGVIVGGRRSDLTWF